MTNIEKNLEFILFNKSMKEWWYKINGSTIFLYNEKSGNRINLPEQLILELPIEKIIEILEVNK